MTELARQSGYGVPLVRSESVELSPHPEHCDEPDLPQWLEEHKSDRLAVDLFSGAGGLSHGLTAAGWTTAVAVDSDPMALRTHAANFPGATLQLDLGDPVQRDHLIALLKGAEIDVVAGGPPCQPFSRAGRSKIRSLVERAGRDPRDHRKDLWAAYLDIVERLSPRAVVMENVPDMGLGDEFRVVRTIESRLETLGYSVDLSIADAWMYGVPQHRRRLILLARRDGDTFEWPASTSRVSVGEAISDLPSLHVEPKQSVGSRVMEYSTPASTPFQLAMRHGVDAELHDHYTRRVREDDHKVFESMSATTLYTQVDASLRRYKTDSFKDKYKRLDNDGLSRTITAHISKDGYWYIHPTEPRTLTVREAARIQTFPDRFRFAGTRSDAFRQIGNAVPPLLALAAASAVLPTEPAATAPVKPHWTTVREALARWAKDPSRTPEEKAFLPGRKTVLQAVVAALLSRSSGSGEGVVAAIRAARRTRLDEETYLRVRNAVPGPMQRRLERGLGPLVGRARLGDLDILAADLGLNSSEAGVLRMLTNTDVLWGGQAAQRVAARLHGVDPAEATNHRTDGLARVARLIGADAMAPTRMAAVRLIGNAICLPADPKCGVCPLEQLCPSSPSRISDLSSKSRG